MWPSVLHQCTASQSAARMTHGSHRHNLSTPASLVGPSQSRFRAFATNSETRAIYNSNSEPRSASDLSRSWRPGPHRLTSTGQHSLWPTGLHVSARQGTFAHELGAVTHWELIFLPEHTNENDQSRYACSRIHATCIKPRRVFYAVPHDCAVNGMCNPNTKPVSRGLARGTQTHLQEMLTIMVWCGKAWSTYA